MTRGDALHWIARPLLAILWALVAWGSLLLLVTVWNAATIGVRPALALLAGDGSSWSLLNALSAALAAVVWLLGAVAVRRRRSSRPADAPAGGAAGEAGRGP